MLAWRTWKPRLLCPFFLLLQFELFPLGLLLLLLPLGLLLLPLGLLLLPLGLLLLPLGLLLLPLLQKSDAILLGDGVEYILEVLEVKAIASALGTCGCAENVKRMGEYSVCQKPCP